MVEDFDVEMIILMKFEVYDDQLKDQTKETISGMHMLLQKYVGSAVEVAIKEDQKDNPPFFKLVETACAKMLPSGNSMPKQPFKGIGGPPKMTGGEGK